MPYLVIENWSGGLSDGSKRGVDGSFRWGQGLNFKDDIDGITANLALVKDSASTVTDLPKWIVYDGVQDNVYAYGNTGKIYQKASGAWSLLRSVANSLGQGMEIYNDYIYYTQNTQIGRYGALSGAPSFTDNWQTGLSGSTSNSWRPIKSFLNLLCVGNGRYLATWDGSTWSATKLTFPPGWYVRDLDVRGDYLAIAVNDDRTLSKATRGMIFYWDGSSSTYNFFNEVLEGGGINSIQANQDSVFVFPGQAGNIYIDTGKVSKIKRIPFVGLGKAINIYPGADTNFRGLLTFGVGGGTSTSVYRGIYEWGQYNLNYPNSLNFSYPISTGSVTGDTVNIGAVKAIDEQIYVGWQDDSNYGIDLLSTTSLQTSVTYDSRVLSLNKECSVERIKLFMDPLASGQSVTVYYKADRAAAWTSYGSATYTSDGAVNTKLITKEFRATDIEIRLVLGGSSSSMPKVYKALVEYKEEERL